MRRHRRFRTVATTWNNNNNNNNNIIITINKADDESDEMMMRANPYVRFVRDTIDATTGRGDDASIVVSRFVHALGALKYALIPPETKAGMFPLMMPVGISPEDGNAIGFLLEPSSVNEEEKITLGPIVKAKPNQKQIEFIAKDATTFVRRVLLEEELAALNKGGGIPQVRDSILRSSLSSSSNTEHAEYDREQLARLATSKHMLNAYMTQNIGSFPDVIESLISRHEFVKKDETSALVACEFYINREEFTNKWARPYAINARTLRRFENRESEARDAARIALSVAPWYTIGGGYSAEESSGGSSSSNRNSSNAEEDAMPPLTGATLEEMKKLVNMENVDAKLAKNILEGVGTEIAKEHEKNAPELSEEAKAFKRCFDILDYASWGNEQGYESWDGIREELSESYEKAGMKRFAKLVKP